MNNEEMIEALGQIRDEMLRQQAMTAISQKANTERTSVTAEADKLAGAVNALAAMARAAKGWADGSAENDGSMGRWDCKPSDEQEFVLADILNMIDEAAREVGVAPVYGGRKKNR